VDQPGEPTHKIHELLMAEEKIKEDRIADYGNNFPSIHCPIMP
jgi:hypothetical protein